MIISMKLKESLFSLFMGFCHIGLHDRIFFVRGAV
jgi:hypothetical protein